MGSQVSPGDAMAWNFGAGDAVRLPAWFFGLFRAFLFNP